MNVADPEKTCGRPAIVACGILKREIRHIVEARGWQVDVTFLDSSLHIYLDRLHTVLTKALSRSGNRPALLVYGACHPQMEDILADAGAARPPVQNCVELLLGRKRFSNALSTGAFFLFEDWSKRWETISHSYFGSWELMRDVFQDAHTHLLCIRTPCSGDFTADAEVVSQRLGLPLVWMDTGLEHLEKTLETSLEHLISGENR
ncbi:MAG TPA: hypothetical protein DHV36_11260 [Desulfobacteraceae bacterium]|nr:hypothetical protein [Desulfobacteraceae bacterium]